MDEVEENNSLQEASVRYLKFKSDACGYNGFTSIIIRNSFQYISDYEDIIKEYKIITGREYKYELTDETMINLMTKYNILGKNNLFELVYVRNTYVPYFEIIPEIACERFFINYDRYKLDTIKKILASETDFQTMIHIIDNIVFNQNNDAILI